jgi:hypothetical protein
VVRYEFEQRSNGRGAVVRIGPRGGRRTLVVYRNQQVAFDMVAEFNRRARWEA